MSMNQDIIIQQHSQDASHTSLLKNIYVGIWKVFNDKPIIYHSSRLKLLDLKKSELERRSFIPELGFFIHLQQIGRAHV